MKSLRYLLTWVIVLLNLFTYSQVTTSESPTPIAWYKLDGTGANAVVGGAKARIINGKAAADRDGRSKGAYSFELSNTHTPDFKNAEFPVDIGPDKVPVLTLTLWVKPTVTNRVMFVIQGGGDKRNRSLQVDLTDGQYRWIMGCGKDGKLDGPPLIADWTFIALIYDIRNQEARMIVNDRVFSSRGTSANGGDNFYIGSAAAVIDDIRLFDRVLTQQEIEAVSGIPITADAEKLVIKDRYGYKEKQKQEEENRVNAGETYIVDEKEFKVTASTDYNTTKNILTEGDSIFILEKLPDGWFKISSKGGEIGYVTRGTITKGAHLAGTSALAHKLSYGFKHIFDFTKLRSWIIVVTFAIILFFVKKYFISLDRWLIRLRKGGDEFADGGSKSDPSIPRTSFLRRIFPVKRYQWYPLMTGVIFGATLFIGSFWDSHEMEWFYNEGISLLPIGYDRPVHWFLYGMTMVTLLLTLTWIVESIVIAGPLIGMLRIILLLILNFMSLMVSFFLLVLIAIIVVVMIALWMFSSAAGSGNYKCPKCGRTFSSSAGSSTSCPGCGARLST